MAVKDPNDRAHMWDRSEHAPHAVEADVPTPALVTPPTGSPAATTAAAAKKQIRTAKKKK